MSDSRAKSADLCMSDAMPFQQGWQYRTTLSLKEIINPDFFRPVNSMLRSGDSITMCRFDGDNERAKRLLEFATVRVVSSGPDAVPLILAGEIVTVPQQSEGAKPETGAVYSVKKQFGGGFIVEDGKGNAVEQLKTKAEADAYADRLNGKLEAA